jgi:hypothetical protein
MPALLSEQEKVVQASTRLFTEEQLMFICEHGKRMLDGVDSSHERIRHARKMLKLLERGRDAAAADPQSSTGSGSAA